MKSEEIVRVSLDEADIKNLIVAHLKSKGLRPKGDFSINVETYTEGYGMSEMDFQRVCETRIECVKE